MMISWLAILIAAVVVLPLAIGMVALVIVAVRHALVHPGALLVLGLVGGGLFLMLLVLVGGLFVARSSRAVHVASLQEFPDRISATPRPFTPIPVAAKPIAPPANGAIHGPAIDGSRPSWIGISSGRHGDVYRAAVVSGPYTTRAECDANLPAELQRALHDFTKAYLGSQAARRVTLSEEQLHEQVKEEWEETLNTGVGPMIQLHALAEFDRRTQELVQDAWRTAVVADRVHQAAAGLAAVLGLLTVAYAGLKISGWRGRREVSA
jgi:hypothetical protein